MFDRLCYVDLIANFKHTVFEKFIKFYTFIKNLGCKHVLARNIFKCYL